MALSDGQTDQHGHGVHLAKNWYELVQRPCLELVHTTLPALSAWGLTMLITFICGLGFALLSVPIAVVEFNQAGNDDFRRLYLVLTVGVNAALPLLLAYAPARVSSEVLKLLRQINELRGRSEFADKFALRRTDRAAHLYNYLVETTDRKGPGFIVGTTVIDLEKMRAAMITIATMGSSLAVYLLELTDAV